MIDSLPYPFCLKRLPGVSSNYSKQVWLQRITMLPGMDGIVGHAVRQGMNCYV
jgi:hypothetical protein